MDQTTATKTVQLTNQHGLHMRPADLFVKLASQFEADVHVAKDGVRVNGKSILDIFTLAADKGSHISIEATGHDAEAALQALVELVDRDFDEAEQSEDQEEAGENIQPR